MSGEVAAKVMFEAGQDMALVLTVASVVEPFLTLGHRTSSISQVRYTCSNSLMDDTCFCLMCYFNLGFFFGKGSGEVYSGCSD